MTKGPVELPHLGAQTADTHAHLDMLDDPAGALERAAIAGVMLVVSVADLTEAPHNAYEHVGELPHAQFYNLVCKGCWPPKARVASSSRSSTTMVSST